MLCDLINDEFRIVIGGYLFSFFHTRRIHTFGWSRCINSCRLQCVCSVQGGPTARILVLSEAYWLLFHESFAHECLKQLKARLPSASRPWPSCRHRPGLKASRSALMTVKAIQKPSDGAQRAASREPRGHGAWLALRSKCTAPAFSRRQHNSARRRRRQAEGLPHEHW